MVVFGIHCNVFIVSPIRLKTCRCYVLFCFVYVLSKYEHFIVLGDFNVGMDNSDMTVFCDTYDLKCLIKEPTML